MNHQKILALALTLLIACGACGAAAASKTLTLPVTPEETEDPSEYDGTACVLTFFRDDAELLRIVHFGNRWLRVDDGPWLRMDYDQAAALEKLLAELQ